MAVLKLMQYPSWLGLHNMYYIQVHVVHVYQSSVYFLHKFPIGRVIIPLILGYNWCVITHLMILQYYLQYSPHKLVLRSNF